MAQFLNRYRCARCGNRWSDVWDCGVDDDCPKCGARHMSPVKSTELDEDDDEEGQDRESYTDDQDRESYYAGDD